MPPKIDPEIDDEDDNIDEDDDLENFENGENDGNFENGETGETSNWGGVEGGRLEGEEEEEEETQQQGERREREEDEDDEEEEERGREGEETDAEYATGEFEDGVGMDPYATGAPEEGDVDVEGGEAEEGEREREEDEDEEDDEDVDVDDDRKENGKGEGFDDSDVDIGGDPSRPGPSTPNYSDEKPVKATIVSAKPAVPQAIFEPEYESLEFTTPNGNVFHKEAFYTEWEKCITEQADEVEEILVPIRIDLEVDNRKIQDTFIWNLKEKSITPDSYAASMCSDLDLPARADRLIADSIRQQLGEFRDYVPQIPSATSRPAIPGASVGQSLPECLVTLKVDLTVNQVLLHDQFEWDLNNPSNAPEPFARALCQDLGLSREFEASVVHAIREQLAYHAQFTLPLMHHTQANRTTVTADKCVRTETELPIWTPVVSNVITARQIAQPPAYPPYGTPQGPVRHSTRLREAASQAQPYALRGATPNR